ncbi:MAG: hypothetical protein B7X86_09005 [Sphingobacteriales bacterium 17-39-43]|uniref:YciI family protein n=1 Tax=Daejeonella sp. TaxID=2805397 RepID=UPI000BD0CD99|nr:YciI family protein [Daejeonella sp.]MCF8452435.1 YciI family protein [Pedobacter sp.]OYY03472.1 MAG: hypothetical protein B7Y76_03800 [Sphingobacteriia bacterium 35-40-5]OYZ33489.1 MAG: hypothetical protein B7Y24_04020 [Sphingobacteriales bacterium 16-39-50]OZA24531.1 MAG: hypothetical protein B7X86_09005 [Sphingobacteriales bacterium 17-39-43]HQS06447.1 YciI family protein [Daejeonella sp.]
MNKIFVMIFLLISGMSARGQSDNPKYNQSMADSLDADDYGMKMYVFVILKTGPVSADKAVTDSLFRGHMENIGRLASSGKLLVAGPMRKNDKNYRGIFILNAANIEEAEKLLETDPAVKAKLLDAELFQWYGSAALAKYLPYHDLVQKKKM